MLMTRRVALLPVAATVAVPTILISGCGQSEARTLADRLGKTKNEANKLEDALASMIYEQANNVSIILTTLILERDLHLEFPVRDKAKAQRISQEITSIGVNLDKELFDQAKKRSFWYQDADNLKRIVDLNDVPPDLYRTTPFIIEDVLANSPEYAAAGYSRERSPWGSDVRNLQKLFDLIREGTPIIDKVLKDSPEYVALDDDLQKALDVYRTKKSGIGPALVILKILLMTHDNVLVPKVAEHNLASEDRYKPIWGFSMERLTALGPLLTIFDSQ